MGQLCFSMFYSVTALLFKHFCLICSVQNVAVTFTSRNVFSFCSRTVSRSDFT
jgi:hypothetical protein